MDVEAELPDPTLLVSETGGDWHRCSAGPRHDRPRPLLLPVLPLAADGDWLRLLLMVVCECLVAPGRRAQRGDGWRVGCAAVQLLVAPGVAAAAMNDACWPWGPCGWCWLPPRSRRHDPPHVSFVRSDDAIDDARAVI